MAALGTVSDEEAAELAIDKREQLLDERERIIERREDAVRTGLYATAHEAAVERREQHIDRREAALQQLMDPAGQYMPWHRAAQLGSSIIIYRAGNGWIIDSQSALGSGPSARSSLVLTLDQLRDAVAAWGMQSGMSVVMVANARNGAPE